jgi:hypothetical protein
MPSFERRSVFAMKGPWKPGRKTAPRVERNIDPMALASGSAAQPGDDFFVDVFSSVALEPAAAGLAAASTKRVEARAFWLMAGRPTTARHNAADLRFHPVILDASQRASGFSADVGVVFGSLPDLPIARGPSGATRPSRDRIRNRQPCRRAHFELDRLTAVVPEPSPRR